MEEIAQTGTSSRVVMIVVVITVVGVAAFTYSYLAPPPGGTNDNSITVPGMPYRDNYTQHGPIVIQGDASLANLAASEGWPGNGSALNPYVIEGLEIQSADVCITISSVREMHIFVRECLLWTTSWQWGICLRILNSSNIEVNSCVAHTGLEGIIAFQSDNLVVKGCGVYDAIFGINASICNNVWIEDCIALNCTFGVTFCAGFQVNVLGTWVFNSLVGIMSQSSNNTDVWNCTVSSNVRGIDVDQDCMNWDIRECTVLNNTEVGIEVGSRSSNITVVLNRIGWNGLNARDDGLVNYWDLGSGFGNTWSDYSGTGVYLIQGTAGSVDHFPTILSH